MPTKKETPFFKMRSYLQSANSLLRDTATVEDCEFALEDLEKVMELLKEKLATAVHMDGSPLGVSEKYAWDTK
jgi:hypothetical protein